MSSTSSEILLCREEPASCLVVWGPTVSFYIEILWLNFIQTYSAQKNDTTKERICYKLIMAWIWRQAILLWANEKVTHESVKITRGKNLARIYSVHTSLKILERKYTIYPQVAKYIARVDCMEKRPDKAKKKIATRRPSEVAFNSTYVSSHLKIP